KHGPALEVAYFGNDPRDIGFSLDAAEQDQARRNWQKRLWRNRKHSEPLPCREIAAGSAPQGGTKRRARGKPREFSVICYRLKERAPSRSGAFPVVELRNSELETVSPI